MAVFTEPTQWTHTLGNHADVSTLPDDASSSAGIASLQKLWQQVNQLPLASGGVAPVRTDVNALFKLLGDSVFYAMQGGIASYNAGYDYPVGALVKYNDVLYFCIQANGADSTVVTPPNSTYWLPLASTDKWGQFPTGFVLPWLSRTAIPNTWLVMNDQSVSKVTYSDLNDFINSDGSLDDPDDNTKVIIPSAVGRVLQGTNTLADVHDKIAAGLPDITGTTTWFFGDGTKGAVSGAFSQVNAQNTMLGGAYTTLAGAQNTFSASASNAIFGANTTVQAPALKTMFIIKA